MGLLSVPTIWHHTWIPKWICLASSISLMRTQQRRRSCLMIYGLSRRVVSTSTHFWLYAKDCVIYPTDEMWERCDRRCISFRLFPDRLPLGFAANREDEYGSSWLDSHSRLSEPGMRATVLIAHSQSLVDLALVLCKYNKHGIFPVFESFCFHLLDFGSPLKPR